MLSEEAINTIRNAVKFKYDEHISRLLAIPEKYLAKIVPNKGLPIIEMLEGLNADTAEEVRRYGEVLRTELARIIDNFGLNVFTEKDMELILQVMEEFCSSEIYKKRFEIMLGSIERKINSYGIAFDIKDYRVDIPKSCCDAGAENSIRRIKAIIANELNCRVVHNQTGPETEEQKVIAKISLLTLFRKIWTDPVLSKVIASIILVIGGLCWAWFHNYANNKYETARRVSPIPAATNQESKVIPAKPLSPTLSPKTSKKEIQLPQGSTIIQLKEQSKIQPKRHSSTVKQKDDVESKFIAEDTMKDIIEAAKHRDKILSIFSGNWKLDIDDSVNSIMYDNYISVRDISNTDYYTDPRKYRAELWNQLNDLRINMIIRPEGKILLVITARDTNVTVFKGNVHNYSDIIEFKTNNGINTYVEQRFDNRIWLVSKEVPFAKLINASDLDCNVLSFKKVGEKKEK